MNGLKILAIGLAVLLGLGASVLVIAGPALDVLGAMTNAGTAQIQEDDTDQIVMGLAQASSNQNAGAMQDDAKEKEQADEKDSDKPGNTKVAQAIAKFFGVSLDDVNKLHSDGLGYGEIVRAYALAKTTGKSASEIVAMKKDGKGWGEIEKSLSVTPGKLSATLGQIMRENKEKHSKNAKANATPPAKGKNK